MRDKLSNQTDFFSEGGCFTARAMLWKEAITQHSRFCRNALQRPWLLMTNHPVKDNKWFVEITLFVLHYDVGTKMGFLIQSSVTNISRLYWLSSNIWECCEQISIKKTHSFTGSSLLVVKTTKDQLQSCHYWVTLNNSLVIWQRGWVNSCHFDCKLSVLP